MPYKSEKQRRFFNANKEEMEDKGVDVDEWNKASKGKDLPETARAGQTYDPGTAKADQAHGWDAATYREEDEDDAIQGAMTRVTPMSTELALASAPQGHPFYGNQYKDSGGSSSEAAKNYGEGSGKHYEETKSAESKFPKGSQIKDRTGQTHTVIGHNGNTLVTDKGNVHVSNATPHGGGEPGKKDRSERDVVADHDQAVRQGNELGAVAAKAAGVAERSRKSGSYAKMAEAYGKAAEKHRAAEKHFATVPGYEARAAGHKDRAEKHEFWAKTYGEKAAQGAKVPDDGNPFYTKSRSGEERTVETFSAPPGHPFYGNQHTTGTSSGGKEGEGRNAESTNTTQGHEAARKYHEQRADEARKAFNKEPSGEHKKDLRALWDAHANAAYNHELAAKGRTFGGPGGAENAAEQSKNAREASKGVNAFHAEVMGKSGETPKGYHVSFSSPSSNGKSTYVVGHKESGRHFTVEAGSEDDAKRIAHSHNTAARGGNTFDKK